MDILTTQFFVNNRRKLIESINADGLIIVPGNGLMQRSTETTYDFRQDSNLFYLCGIEEPNCTLVIDTKTGRSFVMLPIRTGIHAVFEGTQDIEKLKRASGVDEIIDEKAGWQWLRKMPTKAIFMPKKPVTRLGDMYTNPHRASVYSKVRRIFGDNINDIRANLSSLRVIKTTEELACIEKAVQITIASIDAVVAQRQKINSENQLEAELTKNFRVLGASGHAYSPIVASGKASCTLHYINNNSSIKNGDIVLLDVGAEYNNYAADISRTYVWAGQATKRQQSVIEAVKQAQQQLINYLEPGISWKDYAAEADKQVANQLQQLGLLKPGYTQAELRQYFPHAISHFLGLDVHDVGDYTKPLQKGMVIAVEPGIYINNEAIGVRIEDDVVITDNGAKIIS